MRIVASKLGGGNSHLQSFYAIILVAILNCPLSSSYLTQKQIYELGNSVVYFYQNWNYGGRLFYQSSVVTSSCETLPWWTWNRVSSVITRECIILYAYPNCQGRSYRVESNEPMLRYFNDDTDSYRACDDNLDRINDFKDARIQLYDDNYFKLLMWDTLIYPECRNLLYTHIYHKTASLRTDACVILYSESNCGGSFFRVERGNWDTLPYFYDKTDSFRPCNDKDVTIGFTLKAKIFHFEIWSTPEEVSQYAQAGIVEMATSTRFRNNGRAAITQEYSVSKSFTERVELESTTSFSSTHEVFVEAGITAKVSVGIPKAAKLKIEASLKAGYKYIYNSGSSSTQWYINETKKVFTAKETIAVPPCTVYDVTSFLKTTQDYPVHYKVFAEVTGSYDNGRPLSIAEVKGSLGGLKYESTKDATTVIASSVSKLSVDFGVDTEIVGNGTLIEGCNSRGPQQRTGLALTIFCVILSINK